MKLALLFFAIVLFISSCAPTTSQLVTLRSDNLKQSPQQGFVYDNDTLRLAYQFFSERGVIHLSIENKLAKPLYIDWKRSAFIIGQNKLDYWYDEAAVSLYGTAYTTTYGRHFRNWNSSSSTIDLTGSIRKDNAVDFIPPGTKIEKDQFVVIPGNALFLPGNFKAEKVASKIPDRVKPVDVRMYEYSLTDSPLTFRNYLTLSTDKDFKHEVVLDSKFWASDVQVMPLRQLTGGQEWIGSGQYNTTTLKSTPYYRADAFFINYTPVAQ